MSRAKAGYNKYHNSIDIRWAENVIFTVDCGKVEAGLDLTPGGQYEVNALALDHPMEYVRMALEGSMQSWADCSEESEGY